VERSISKVNFIIQVKEALYIDIVHPERKPQMILLCGWRQDIDDMIVVSSSWKLLIHFLSVKFCRLGEVICLKTLLFQSLQKEYGFVVGGVILKI
jgi:hypothetical protein